MNIDFIKPGERSEKFTLSIRPIGPVNMQRGASGAHYSTFIIPHNRIIFGMIENLMRIWTDDKTRAAIRKNFDISTPEKRSGYKYGPVIHDAFDVLNKIMPEHTLFTDFQSRLWFANDDRMSNSMRNVDESLLMTETKILIATHSFMSNHQGKDAGTGFSKEARGKMPTYYPAPKTVEWVKFHGDILIECESTTEFRQALEQVLQERRTSYLGNSEGIVEIKMI